MRKKNIRNGFFHWLIQHGLGRTHDQGRTDLEWRLLGNRQPNLQQELHTLK
jgi:hypothetical protein